VAVLTRFLGDISFAEEAVQEAFAIALAKWPSTGIPPSPVGWLITTARNKALDRLRKEASRSERQHAAQLLNDVEPAVEHDVHDDHLRLIFTCCHPALAPDAQAALTLRLIGGLSTDEIAHAFLLQPTTLAQMRLIFRNIICTMRFELIYCGGLGAQPMRRPLIAWH
jgi:RNA polymerase sigma-70 factor (ECF subfamily)